MLRLRKLMYGIMISILFIAVFWGASAQALEGKAGEVIRTVEDLKELEAKGLLSRGQVLAYTEIVKVLGRPIPITGKTDCSPETINSINYLKVTQMNKGKAKIGTKDELLNYAGLGLPFPGITKDDPQAGIKIAWNYEYKHEGDDREGVWTYWLTDDKKNVKTLEGNVKRLSFFGRTDLDPRPNISGEAGVRSKEVITFTAPFASKGMAQLSVKYVDPQRDKGLWVFVPGLRRNVRIGGGNRCDCLGGFVHNMDDQTTWDGNPLLFSWKSLGLKEMLIPTVMPSEKGFPYVPKAYVIPITLERRPLWVIEQTPKDPGYCYSKRIFLVDPETWWFFNSDCYDRSGKIWKIVHQYYCLVPNPKSAGGGYAVYTNAGSVVDFKIGEAGPYVIENVKINTGKDVMAFTLDAMRRSGR